MFITISAFCLYFVDCLSFTLCLNFMSLSLCYFQGRCCRILFYFLSLLLFLCGISFVGRVFGNIHYVGSMGCYSRDWKADRARINGGGLLGTDSNLRWAIPAPPVVDRAQGGAVHDPHGPPGHQSWSPERGRPHWWMSETATLHGLPSASPRMSQSEVLELVGAKAQVRIRANPWGGFSFLWASVATRRTRRTRRRTLPRTEATICPRKSYRTDCQVGPQRQLRKPASGDVERLPRCQRFDPGGSLDRRVNCRRVPQPRWVGARRSAKGGKPEGDRRKRGNPRPSCLSRA
jgi:hypothetical protein